MTYADEETQQTTANMAYMRHIRYWMAGLGRKIGFDSILIQLFVGTDGIMITLWVVNILLAISGQTHIFHRIRICSEIELIADNNFSRSSSLDYNWLVLMAGGPEAGGSPVAMLVWIGLLFALMYLMLIRPQRKKQKDHNKLLTELKKGDKVVTTGGMFGHIFAIDDERNIVVLKINEIKLEFLKSSIAARVDK